MPEMDKPIFVENCKHLNSCYNGRCRYCVGCNIWNLRYDTTQLINWCLKQGVSFSETVDDLARQLL